MIKIPKLIRDEIQKGILEHLNSKGLIITSPAFKYSSEMIKLRYLIINKAGVKFGRRISFRIKRQKTLDPLPKCNQRFYDEVQRIHVYQDKSKVFTSPSFPCKKPNFKLSKANKENLMSRMLDYVATINMFEKDFSLNSPSFEYHKNRILMKYFDGKQEKTVKFRFIKENQISYIPDPKLNRTLNLFVEENGVLRNDLIRPY